MTSATVRTTREELHAVLDEKLNQMHRDDVIKLASFVEKLARLRQQERQAGHPYQSTGTLNKGADTICRIEA